MMLTQKCKRLMVVLSLCSLFVLSVLLVCDQLFIRIVRSQANQGPDLNPDESKKDEFRLVKILKDTKLNHSSLQRIDAIRGLRDLAKSRRILSEDGIRTIADNLDVNKNTVLSGVQDSNGSEVVVVRETHLDPPEETYPAIGALMYVGKAALPSVLKIIETSDSETLHSQNATFVLLHNFGEDMDLAINFLIETSKKTTSKLGKDRLLTLAGNLKAQR